MFVIICMLTQQKPIFGSPVTYCELLRDTDCFVVSLDEHELKCMPVAKTTAYTCLLVFDYE